MLFRSEVVSNESKGLDFLKEGEKFYQESKKDKPEGTDYNMGMAVSPEGKVSSPSGLRFEELMRNRNPLFVKRERDRVRKIGEEEWLRELETELERLNSHSSIKLSPKDLLDESETLLDQEIAED